MAMSAVEKKRSNRRISSMFSSSSSAPSSRGSGAASVASSDSGSRLSRMKKRVSSFGPTVEYPPSPPPPIPRIPTQPAQQSATLQPVQPAPATLEPVLEPPPRVLSDPSSRSSSPSRLTKSRPGTPSRPGTSSGRPSGDTSGGLLVPADPNAKKTRRRSRLFGGGESSDEKVGALEQDAPLAWVVGHKGKVAYNLTLLLNGEKVPELWDEQGDTFVYLFPRTSNKGPSFRLDSSVYGASRVMTRLVHGRLYSEATANPHELPDRFRSVSVPPSRTGSPDQSVADSSDGSKGSRALSDATEDDHTEKHLYVPIALSTDQSPIGPQRQEQRLSDKDIDTLVTYRNFFAFLIGQSLVATRRHPDIFDIFLRIADILQHYNFANVDKSTYGEVAASSFDSYVEELNLADVRNSREKTIEALVLGEKMRCMSLYNEGFVHAAGKFESIKELRHPKFDLINHKTVTRIARAALDLENREMNINLKLKEFEFAAMFAGIMNSDTSDEKKMISFKRWKSAFMSTRSFTLDYYKHKYGGWLPKAASKKNTLTVSGLNRLVLRDLYQDLCDLYELLVDRTNLTNRTADGFMSEDERPDFESVACRALRKVLSEYDRSVPPVQPPIPFDVPLLPTLKGLKRDYPSGDLKKDQKARGKKLGKDEIAKMLQGSHNADAAQKKTPFVEAYLKFEHKQASGSTMEELCQLRVGQWLFLYATIQSLPMLVVDAPRLRYTEGVEYFLCEVPRSGVPWVHEDTNRTRTWFGVAGGSQVVSLPSDVVEHGVEGIFRRSHCWKMAGIWAQGDMMLNAAMQEMNAAPLPPPPHLLDPNGGGNRPRSMSPDSRRESVMDLGLEALPLPPGIAPPMGSSSSRPSSVHDPTKTFEAMLGVPPSPMGKKGKKK